MPHVVRFDCYEADLDSGVLRKRGLRIRLPGQSFEVLASLLEHPGQVVTRDELQHRLWRDEVFVDFDHNLNTAIARLREALADSADRPRFIETLPKRGYRDPAETRLSLFGHGDVISGRHGQRSRHEVAAGGAAVFEFERRSGSRVLQRCDDR